MMETMLRETYHYRVGDMDSSRPLCGASIDGARDYLIFDGYFVGLASNYGPGADLGLTGREVVLCPQCYHNEEVALRLLGVV